jgi:hypothetical protein
VLRPRLDDATSAAHDTLLLKTPQKRCRKSFMLQIEGAMQSGYKTDSNVLVGLLPHSH